FEAGKLGQHEVEHDQIVVHVNRLAGAGFAVMQDIHGVSFFLQSFCDEAGDFLFILDDQDTHRSSTVSNTCTSVRRVARVRKSIASSQNEVRVFESKGAFRIESFHSFQSFGMSSSCGYTDSRVAAVFLPQFGIPGNPSALSPTSAR